MDSGTKEEKKGGSGARKMLLSGQTLSINRNRGRDIIKREEMISNMESDYQTHKSKRDL